MTLVRQLKKAYLCLVLITNLFLFRPATLIAAKLLLAFVNNILHFTTGGNIYSLLFY